jgi:hypothetical protein
MRLAVANLLRNAISTVTVYITTTQYAQGPTVVAAGGGVQQQTATVVQGGGGGGIVIVGTTTAPVTYDGFCTTIYAQNVETPTRAAVPCGVALVVGGATRFQIWRSLSLVGGFWAFLLAMMISTRLHR